MRMVMEIKLPAEAFNAAVRDGSAGPKLKKILEEAKPEAMYFTAREGHRGGIMILDLKDPSEMPKYAEPWFLSFNAEITYLPAMTPEDLAKAGLDDLAKKYA